MIYGTAQWRRVLSAIVLFVVLVFSLTTTASFASLLSSVASGSTVEIERGVAIRGGEESADAAADSSNVTVDSSAWGAVGVVGALKPVPVTNGMSSLPQNAAASGTNEGTEANVGPGQAGSSPLVVIGFSGVLWKNVTPELMPHLYRFIDDVAGANIVVRTVGETTCPNEGWLTVGAGQRATDAVRDCRAQGAPELAYGESGGGEGAPASVASAEGSYVVQQWETYVQANR